jgi:hypothetical protein
MHTVPQKRIQIKENQNIWMPELNCLKKLRHTQTSLCLVHAKRVGEIEPGPNLTDQHGISGPLQDSFVSEAPTSWQLMRARLCYLLAVNVKCYFPVAWMIIAIDLRQPLDQFAGVHNLQFCRVMLKMPHQQDSSPCQTHLTSSPSFQAHFFITFPPLPSVPRSQPYK